VVRLTGGNPSIPGIEKGNWKMGKVDQEGGGRRKTKTAKNNYTYMYFHKRDVGGGSEQDSKHRENYRKGDCREEKKSKKNGGRKHRNACQEGKANPMREKKLLNGWQQERVLTSG